MQPSLTQLLCHISHGRRKDMHLAARHNQAAQVLHASRLAPACVQLDRDWIAETAAYVLLRHHLTVQLAWLEVAQA
jgi:hypothetical protein